MKGLLILFVLICITAFARAQDSISLSNTAGFKLWVNGGYGTGSIFSDNQRSERCYLGKLGVDASIGRYYFSYEYANSIDGGLFGGRHIRFSQCKDILSCPGTASMRPLKVKIIASSGVTFGKDVWRGAYRE